ncbi:hypothetical protein BCR33DRAFT_457900 [Rhizoclosmatium globosum]|uniref:Uncharacterized protein n=1 Tax=Rhizoclosmatium globosum TaxID=329046 RepID=A0A1Y2CWY1_9FUNG|nr:hypothetical protein BCR33DRAFT_457900 [Rhizoclosmatium globosum]|eukprot:ORY51533.1 hypothetical protein BCR33DRAFT_457900 [Rhizoclosmatium globosum]
MKINVLIVQLFSFCYGVIWAKQTNSNTELTSSSPPCFSSPKQTGVYIDHHAFQLDSDGCLTAQFFADQLPRWTQRKNTLIASTQFWKVVQNTSNHIYQPRSFSPCSTFLEDSVRIM